MPMINQFSENGPVGVLKPMYNGRRSHSSLDRRTPDQAYFTPLPIRMAA
jgi:putative transposase